MLVYEKIAHTIKQAIQSGEFSTGEALPSERKLTEMYAISRSTIRRAILLLTEEGLLETRPGSGTYVSERYSESFSSLTGLSEEAEARGMGSSSEWLSREMGSPTPVEAFNLGIPPTEIVTRISRLRHANGEPLALQTAVITRMGLPSPDCIDSSLYEAMAQYGERPVRAYQRIAAIAIVGEQARLLGVQEGAPGLQTWRVGYCASGVAVEYTQSLFRGDRWDFITELTLKEKI